MATATMTRELRPLGEHLGTEALGINLAKLDNDTFAWIADAFAQHPVLVFRNQHLGANDIAAFGRRFGTPRKHSLVNYRHADNPDVSWIRNVDDAGNIDWFGVKRATDWHTDSTYEEVLPLLAMLHAVEVPSKKGGTLFADMCAAYDALPETMKQRLQALSACMAAPTALPAPGSTICRNTRTAPTRNMTSSAARRWSTIRSPAAQSCLSTRCTPTALTAWSATKPGN